VCQEFEIENEIIPRIAICFAGAVVGTVMAIGLKQGRADTMEEWLRELAVAREFRRRFEAEMETISCRELTGADLTTEEGLEQFMSSDTPQTVCFPAVGVAYQLVVDLLKETS
jgi:predicted acylesterase/phospholipase RssA